VGRILGLLLLCFIVGVVLAFLGTTPATLFRDLWGALLGAWGTVVDVFAWAMPYIVLGAMVVVPIAVVSWLLRLARRS
jgi:Na+/H+-dicarboxylate symporter